eukprot:1189572-Prorocentrum_minimum.AAC.5
MPRGCGQRADYLHNLEQRVVGWPKTLERLVEKGYVKDLESPFAEKLYTLFRIWDVDRDLYVDTIGTPSPHQKPSLANTANQDFVPYNFTVFTL